MGSPRREDRWSKISKIYEKRYSRSKKGDVGAAPTSPFSLEVEAESELDLSLARQELSPSFIDRPKGSLIGQHRGLRSATGSVGRGIGAGELGAIEDIETFHQNL